MIQWNERVVHCSPEYKPRGNNFWLEKTIIQLISIIGLHEKRKLRVIVLSHLTNYLPYSMWTCAVAYRTPQTYLGLMVGIWACLGLDFVSLSTIFSILSHFMGKLCPIVTFLNRSLGLIKWFNTLLVLRQYKIISSLPFYEKIHKSPTLVLEDHTINSLT